ncbi:translocation and assembly module protein TamB, partial [Cereibacter changlensis]
RARLIDTGASRGGGAARRPFGLNLTISSPDRIFIRGRGLDAELGGELLISGTTANVVPSGAFNLIRGRLDILGKRLVLSEALLQLQGDFVPYVRVVASNESDGIISSVVIQGQVNEPEVSFSSVPELPQEEVLSRLLFGRGLTSISALQAAQLASAVATLAGRGGQGIVGNLREGFGLDDLDIVTDAEGDASLRAGKYLSENVYTEIEVGQQGQSQINLNLDVTRNVTVRGSAGGDGGTSLGVFIEKDY